MSENKTPDQLKSKVFFNDGTVQLEEERYTNTAYKSNDRKRWEFVTGWACPFKPGYSWVIQKLQGDFGTPNIDGHDSNGWREAKGPALTRIVYMQMLEDGQIVNVHGKKKSE